MCSIFFDHGKIKLEIDNRKITRKSSDIKKIINTLLNNPEVNEEIKIKTRTCFELNMQHTKLCRSFAVFGGKHVALNVYIRKEERMTLIFLSFALSFHLKKLEWIQHIRSKESRS